MITRTDLLSVEVVVVELHGFEVVIFSVSWLIEALASGVGNHTRVLPMFGEKKKKRKKKPLRLCEKREIPLHE